MIIQKYKYLTFYCWRKEKKKREDENTYLSFSDFFGLVVVVVVVITPSLEVSFFLNVYIGRK